MSDKDGLASPLDNDLRLLAPLSGYAMSNCETYVLALGNGSEVDFYLGLGQNIGGGGHVDEEVCWAESLAVRSSSIRDPNHPQNSQLLFSSSVYATPLDPNVVHLSVELSQCWRPTLYSRLRAKRTQRTHGSDHEVLEDLGAGLASLIPVCGERGNLGRVLGALEGAVERRSRGVAGLQSGAAGRPSDGHLVSGP